MGTYLYQYGTTYTNKTSIGGDITDSDGFFRPSTSAYSGGVSALFSVSARSVGEGKVDNNRWQVSALVSSDGEFAPRVGSHTLSCVMKVPVSQGAGWENAGRQYARVTLTVDVLPSRRWGDGFWYARIPIYNQEGRYLTNLMYRAPGTDGTLLTGRYGTDWRSQSDWPAPERSGYWATSYDGTAYGPKGVVILGNLQFVKDAHGNAIGYKWTGVIVKRPSETATIGDNGKKQPVRIIPGAPSSFLYPPDGKHTVWQLANDAPQPQAKVWFETLISNPDGTAAGFDYEEITFKEWMQRQGISEELQANSFFSVSGEGANWHWLLDSLPPDTPEFDYEPATPIVVDDPEDKSCPALSSLALARHVTGQIAVKIGSTFALITGKLTPRLAGQDGGGTSQDNASDGIALVARDSALEDIRRTDVRRSLDHGASWMIVDATGPPPAPAFVRVASDGHAGQIVQIGWAGNASDKKAGKGDPLYLRVARTTIGGKLIWSAVTPIIFERQLEGQSAGGDAFAPHCGRMCVRVGEDNAVWILLADFDDKWWIARSSGVATDGTHTPFYRYSVPGSYETARFTHWQGRIALVGHCKKSVAATATAEKKTLSTLIARLGQWNGSGFTWGDEVMLADGKELSASASFDIVVRRDDLPLIAQASKGQGLDGWVPRAWGMTGGSFESGTITIS